MEAIGLVAQLMAMSAVTAPKNKGENFVIIAIVDFPSTSWAAHTWPEIFPVVSAYSRQP